MTVTPPASAPPRAVLALVAAAYLLPLVVPVPLMEDDEGLHAAIAIEMVERGDWVVPRLMGQPFLDKPILYFWMQAASLAALGASELAVRLPGTLVALTGIAATGWLGRVLFGGIVGAWAAVCYATMLLPFAVSLAPLHDLVMVPLVAATFGAFWRLHRAGTTGAAVTWTVAAGVALGLSILGKGLTGVGLVGVGMVVWMLWTRTWPLRLIVGAVAALALAALIAWPWYAAMEQASPGYLDYFFLQRHIGGVTSDTQRHAGRPVYYYLPVLVGGAWPWVLTLLRPRGPATAAERLLWAWFLADFVLLSAAGSKLPTYLLPAFPAVAIAAAARLGDWQPPAWATAVTMALAPIAAVVLERVQGTLPPPVWAYGVLLGPAVFAVGIWRGVVARSWSTAARVASVAAVVLVVTALVLRPMAAAQLTARGLADEMNRRGVMPRTLIIVDEGVGSFLFYLRPDLRRGLTPDRVQRISRFSLADARDADGVLVAVAADRLEGVRELYDVPAHGQRAVGGFHVWPFADIHPKPR